MPKRPARPRARRKIPAHEWYNLKHLLEFGPANCGTGPLWDLERREIGQLVTAWHLYAPDIMAEGDVREDHWAHRVLDLGLDPLPVEDARFGSLPPEEADTLRDEQRQHELAQAEFARQVLAELRA
jgi:hypothetical protein